MAVSAEISTVCVTPIGSLKLVAKAEGICAVKWLSGRHRDCGESAGRLEDDDTSTSVTVREVKSLESTSDQSPEQAQAVEHLRVCVNWLKAYFDGSLLASNPPKPPLVFPMKGTFFHKVWSTLESTGIGERVSYAELAKLVGSPRAARAVGQAVKKHCLPILVPCHRVVKSRSGGIGNYSGGEGPATKEWLLQHEKHMLLSSK